MRSMMHTRYLTLLALLLAAALVAGCGGAEATDAGPAVRTSTVQVVDDDFTPPDAEVTAGDTVTWQWDGSSQHNVVGDGFESPVQDAGTFEHRFTEPGTYPYRCTLHGGMQGTVTVVAAGSDGEEG